MWKIISIIALFLYSCSSAFGNDNTAACRDVTRQTCQGFQQCCSRSCGGPFSASCNEQDGRISIASCNCDRSSGSGSPGHQHTVPAQGSVDHSNICRLAAEGSCHSFRSCCNNKCSNPLRLSCSQSGSTLTNTVCQCPASGHGLSGGGHSHSGGGGLHESGDQDFTHTCTRNNNDCQQFRTCCANRCSGRNMETQCQERFGSLKNTVCKCTSRH